MREINVLDKQTAELIAAGEVVDRPASVVKELIENAIDAGAGVITVEIQNGGISYIRITDNGAGIDHTQVKKAFLRHATSKVKTSEDLNNIFTLGFRGEALASIAAMCRVEIMTKTGGSLEGTRFQIEGGEEKAFEAVGCPVGTTIIVRDIFFNTPARMKFLKKDVTEGNSVAAIVEKVAISHPEVSIKFIRDGVIKLQTPGDNNVLSAVSAVYGREFAQSLVGVRSEVGNFTVTGFVSKPELCKNSRRFQTFFINSRYVKSNTAMAAVEEAYKNSMMVGKFPACVLNISVPTDSVDVNVHPAKIEVRFSNEKKVFDCVYYGVKNAVARYDSLQPATFEHPGEPSVPSLTPFDLAKPTCGEQQRFLTGVSPKAFHEILQDTKAESSASVTAKQTYITSPKKEGVSVQKTEPISYVKINNTTKMPPISSVGTGEHLRYFVDGKNIYKDKSIKDYDGETCIEDTVNTSEVIVHHMHDEVMKNFDDYKEIPKDFSIRDVSSIKKASACATTGQHNAKFEGGKILGELFTTYIVVEINEKLLLVDKHAAHERLIFEKLRDEFLSSGVSKQGLLTPINIRLDYELFSVAMDNLNELNMMGFEAEEFGKNTVLLREIPMFLSQAQAQDVFCELLESLNAQKCDLTPEAYDDLLHSMSCKAAIKANDKNDVAELERILELLNDHDDVKYCPHGRPIYTSISKREIEKLFGRTK